MYVIVIIGDNGPTKDKKGRKSGKGRERQQHSIEIKQFAIEKHKNKVKNSVICAEILKTFKVKVSSSSSTVATWYHPKNISKIEAMGVDNITSKESRVNQVQRPHILVDMEYFLLMYIERQQDNGIPVLRGFPAKIN